MKEFELTLLGTSSSQPAFDRFPTSGVLRYHNDLYLIDCGEGTQIQLSRLQNQAQCNKSHIYQSFARRSYFWLCRRGHFFYIIPENHRC